MEYLDYNLSTLAYRSDKYIRFKEVILNQKDLKLPLNLKLQQFPLQITLT